MKSRSPLVTAALALMGVLVVSMGLVALGTRESRAFPSAESYLPSGSAAFAELLRQSGYKVVVEHRVKPQLQRGDLVIAFNLSAPIGRSLISSEANQEEIDATKDVISNFVKAGGKVLSLPVSPDFADQSRNLYDKKLVIRSAAGSAASVSWAEYPSPGFYLDAGGKPIQLWGITEPKGDESDEIDDNKPFVMQKNVGKGSEVNIAAGVIATNRFIDRQQNALVLFSAVNVLARPGSRVVFVEATFGNGQNPGLLAMIGPWALAAWFQILFLAAVVIYTLGKPFGLPDAERRQQRGARDLMDAMADTLRRGRMSKLALKTVFDDTQRVLRKLYRGKREPDRVEMEANNMTELQRALNKIEAAAEIGAPEDMAAKMIQDVERLAREASSRGRGAY